MAFSFCFSFVGTFTFENQILAAPVKIAMGGKKVKPPATDLTYNEFIICYEKLPRVWQKNCPSPIKTFSWNIWSILSSYRSIIAIRKKVLLLQLKNAARQGFENLNYLVCISEALFVMNIFIQRIVGRMTTKTESAGKKSSSFGLTQTPSAGFKAAGTDFCVAANGRIIRAPSQLDLANLTIFADIGMGTTEI